MGMRLKGHVAGVTVRLGSLAVKHVPYARRQAPSRPPARSSYRKTQLRRALSSSLWSTPTMANMLFTLFFFLWCLATYTTSGFPTRSFKSEQVPLREDNDSGPPNGWIDPRTNGGRFLDVSIRYPLNNVSKGDLTFTSSQHHDTGSL